MQGEMTNDTKQQSSRRGTEDRAGAEAKVNEKTAITCSEQAGQFLAWWKEYQKKMKSAFKSGAMKLQMQP